MCNEFCASIKQDACVLQRAVSVWTQSTHPFIFDLGGQAIVPNHNQAKSDGFRREIFSYFWTLRKCILTCKTNSYSTHLIKMFSSPTELQNDRNYREVLNGVTGVRLSAQLLDAGGGHATAEVHFVAHYSPVNRHIRISTSTNDARVR